MEVDSELLQRVDYHDLSAPQTLQVLFYLLLCALLLAVVRRPDGHLEMEI